MTDTRLSAPQSRQPSWGGVFAMSLAAFVLVASEFMPVSLLTPIATDFQVSEGQAGLSISVSGLFALLTSLVIASVAARVERKRLLLCLTLLMIASATVTAFAPNYALFMAGRALIGIAIGGFWSLSAATAMQLVPEDQVPRALAIVNGGNALATVIAAPLGSFLGALIGSRYGSGAAQTTGQIAGIGAQTLILLPNPNASRSDYIDGLKLTESEFKVVTALDERSRCFLVKQGHASTVCQLNLRGMDDILSVISASTDNIDIMHRVLQTAAVGGSGAGSTRPPPYNPSAHR